MTEFMHPVAVEAAELVQQARFCEFLDATAASPSRWPHNRTTARRWLCVTCDVEAPAWIATSGPAYRRFREVLERYRVWRANQELPL